MSVIGLKVGPFEIVDSTEVPEPGTWYVARRSGGEETALVRLVPPGAPAAERAAVQRQVEVLRGLEDPRVPGVLGWYEGLGAVAMHDARGVPLAEAVRGRAGDLALSPATLLDLLVALAETLQRAHHRNRVHGHLDGTNVVLAADGTLWVLGWGTDRPPAHGWCPPEIARGERAVPATDQWSLAALGAALVSGRAPWDEPESPVTGLPGGVLAPVERQWVALGRILRRMLDTTPGARFPSMHAARAELLALSRQVRTPSDRRTFAAALSRGARAPNPEPSAAPRPAAPIDPADVDLLAPEPERPAFPVVRPDIRGEDLPETSTIQALLDRPDVTTAPVTSPPLAPAGAPVSQPPPDVFGAWSDEDDDWGAAPTAVPATDSGDETDDAASVTTDPNPPAAFGQWFDPSPDKPVRGPGALRAWPPSEPVITAPNEPLPPRDDDPLPPPRLNRVEPASAVSARTVAFVLAAVWVALAGVWIVARVI